jgi:2-keto-4-pentenoate hydratase
VNTPTLTDVQVAEVAAQLAAAAQDRRAIDQLAYEPGDVAEGYRIQDAGHRLHRDELVGWKAGCTSEAAQQMLRVDAPLIGRYRSGHVSQSPAAFTADAFVTAPHLEVEIGLRALRDLTDVPADPLDLAEAVEAFAAVEVVASRLAAFPLIGAAQLAADNVIGARMVVGQTLDLTTAGIRDLDTTRVELGIDGEVVAAATGAEALGHPLLVLQWVAAHATALGHPIRSGELVITGTCTGLVPARVGADHVGRVGGAEVRVRFD